MDFLFIHAAFTALNILLPPFIGALPALLAVMLVVVPHFALPIGTAEHEPEGKLLGQRLR